MRRKKPSIDIGVFDNSLDKSPLFKEVYGLHYNKLTRIQKLHIYELFVKTQVVSILEETQGEDQKLKFSTKFRREDIINQVKSIIDTVDVEGVNNIRQNERKAELRYFLSQIKYVLSDYISLLNSYFLDFNAQSKQGFEEKNKEIINHLRVAFGPLWAAYSGSSIRDIPSDGLIKAVINHDMSFDPCIDCLQNRKDQVEFQEMLSYYSSFGVDLVKVFSNTNKATDGMTVFEEILQKAISYSKEKQLLIGTDVSKFQDFITNVKYLRLGLENGWSKKQVMESVKKFIVDYPKIQDMCVRYNTSIFGNSQFNNLYGPIKAFSIAVWLSQKQLDGNSKLEGDGKQVISTSSSILEFRNDFKNKLSNNLDTAIFTHVIRHLGFDQDEIIIGDHYHDVFDFNVGSFAINYQIIYIYFKKSLKTVVRKTKKKSEQ